MYKYLSSCDIRNLKLILTCIFSLLFRYFFPVRCFQVLTVTPPLMDVTASFRRAGRGDLCTRLPLLRWTRTHTLAPLEAACTGGSWWWCAKGPPSKGVISAIESIVDADFSVISNSGRSVRGVPVGRELSLLSIHTVKCHNGGV